MPGAAAWSTAARLVWLSQQGESEGDIAAREVLRLGRLQRHGPLGASDAGYEAAVTDDMVETACAEIAARRLTISPGGERQRVLLAADRMLVMGRGLLGADDAPTYVPLRAALPAL